MYRERSWPTLIVRVDGGKRLRFSHGFHVGRGGGCELHVDDDHVSRTHLHIRPIDGCWSFEDLGSANGVFVDGARVSSGLIVDGMTMRLGGRDGPALVARFAEDEADLQASIDRALDSRAEDGGSGGRTRMIKDAIAKARKAEWQRVRSGLIALTAIAILACVYAGYLYRRNQVLEAQAADNFYRIREIDYLIASRERTAEADGRSVDAAETAARTRERQEAEAKYDKYLNSTQVYGRPLTHEEKLILKVMRIFGESELIVPEAYLREVHGYILGWQRSNRYAKAMAVARERGYVRRIVDEFTRHHLPPQYLYLAMQESDFNPFAVGRPTRYGRAKGMWQFIPRTGEQYGLNIGPLKDEDTYDAADERLKWDQATVAAAKYIKYIYATDAQASGLLVMASYNWGERRVVERIRKLPDNPRARNFWLLLRDYRGEVPDETYGYVFSIVSAAVIGEDPRHFGFEFDNPIQEVLRSPTQGAVRPGGRDVP
jgi:membrane-bound lytic murein transglycosylase D